jgi:hypothetical protein
MCAGRYANVGCLRFSCGGQMAMPAPGGVVCHAAPMLLHTDVPTRAQLSGLLDSRNPAGIAKTAV